MRISDWSSDVCSSDLTRLPALRVDDPSLQVHACHTRLRELQVLYDQLRALFEDPRFDPPLQPREVAVLAPDIDTYLPYMDAVFGGRGRGDTGANQALHYAAAAATPLALHSAKGRAGNKGVSKG